MTELEGPDETITLQRAAELAGLALHTLSDAARAGRLKATRPGHDWLTTRRDLHRYLRGRSRGVIKPLPPDYQTPEGEELIAASRPGRSIVIGMPAVSPEVGGIQSPIASEEANRLAKALRAFPDLAPALSMRDVAALQAAAEILERITGADRE
jgi:excisionase family DNA binding protein